ncbi:MAG: (d)CMP kinase, partial [Candidatus Latescibacterota bacterium]
WRPSIFVGNPKNHPMKTRPEKNEILERLVITIDGPAGSGKTTTARGVARRLNLRHIDTGAMYRAVTWKVLETGTDIRDGDRVGRVALDICIAFADHDGSPKTVIADGTDVTDAIRSSEVTENVSLVSSYPLVRKAMVRMQRRFARSGGVVLEGRDIGSVVLPDAEVKIYLDASTEERARRRLKELEAKGVTKGMDEVRESIERRDRLDSGHELSPLKIPVGAHIVDTTDLTIDGQVARVCETATRTAARLFELMTAEKDPNRFKREKPIYRLGRLTILFLARILFGLRIVGREGYEFYENYVYASNHRSNVDPPVVGSTIGRELAFLAKESLFRNKLFGKLIATYNAIPTRRDAFDRRVIRRALALLDAGGSLLIFPEGQRVAGERLGDAKAGVGYLALKSGAPVVPIYVSGTQNLGRALIRRPRITVLRGRPIRVTDSATAEPTGANSREFGRMVMSAIETLHEDFENDGKLLGGS